MFRFLQAPILGMVYGSAMDPGDAEKNPALMQAAYDLGQRLGGKPGLEMDIPTLQTARLLLHPWAASPVP